MDIHIVDFWIEYFSDIYSVKNFTGYLAYLYATYWHIDFYRFIVGPIFNKQNSNLKRNVKTDLINQMTKCNGKNENYPNLARNNKI
jgi:hypothetical protein